MVLVDAFSGTMVINENIKKTYKNILVQTNSFTFKISLSNNFRKSRA